VDEAYAAPSHQTGTALRLLGLAKTGLLQLQLQLPCSSWPDAGQTGRSRTFSCLMAITWHACNYLGMTNDYRVWVQSDRRQHNWVYTCSPPYMSRGMIGRKQKSKTNFSW